MTGAPVVDWTETWEALPHARRVAIISDVVARHCDQTARARRIMLCVAHRLAAGNIATIARAFHTTTGAVLRAFRAIEAERKHDRDFAAELAALGQKIIERVRV
jgi:chromosomal replication initiation ATPase DnaA